MKSDWFFFDMKENIYTVVAITQLLGGFYLLLIGFKVINPSKKSLDSDEVKAWCKKYGLLIKLGGFIMVLAGIMQFV